MGEERMSLHVHVHVCITFLLQIILSEADLKSNIGYRTFTYKDIADDVVTKRFSMEGLDDFYTTIVDPNRRQLIVGARNHILRLDLLDLKPLELVEWKPGIVNVTTCLAKGQTEDVCHNFIRVLLLHNNSVFICGTNAFSPACSWRNPLRLERVESWLSGVAKCPYDPRHNSTALLTGDGNLYTATVTDFTARDAVISRLIGPAKHLRSVQYNSRWLNEPNFVSSYEIGDYVYFFFREAAIEYINCGKAVYSRVARICKSDSGGQKFLLDDNWTTFVKARLNCSIGGDYPFYFNELQDTYYDEESNRIYAIFNTPATSIYGSAVCVYSIDEINRAFTQSYKYQTDASMAWVREPNLQPNFHCPSSTVESGRSLMDAQKFQLMDQAVQSLNLAPLMTAENERYTKILVENVKTSSSNKQHTVLFLATLEGSIHKLSVRVDLTVKESKEASSNILKAEEEKLKVCLLEILELSESNQPGYIYSMNLNNEGFIFVSTKNSVIKLPVERCSKYSTKRQCKNAQDPFCDWIDGGHGLGRCAAIGNSNLTSCPVADPDPIDGQWSDWSEWKYCHHTYFALSTTDDSCKCRTRTCSNPHPKHGGRFCSGHKVEVANCSVPKHFTAFGRWSDWSTWSDCTTECGQGYIMRTRTCLPILPEFTTNANCIGNSVEWKECKGLNCYELQKISNWTRWYRSTLGEGQESGLGYKEERHRCTCTAIGLEPSQLNDPSIKTVARFCSASGADCKIEPSMDVDGGWSGWSNWSTCSVTCSTGIQTRTRLCDSPLPEGRGAGCAGNSIEHRACELLPCLTDARWSCWSDYSDCSVSCGQDGFKQRTRECIGGHQGSKGCEGEALEIIKCEPIPCYLEPVVGEVSSQNTTSTSLAAHSILWLSLVAGIGFMAAIPVTFIFVILCQRHLKKNRKWQERMNNRVKVEQNEYTNNNNRIYKKEKYPRPLVHKSQFGGSHGNLHMERSPTPEHHYYSLSPYQNRKKESSAIYIRPPQTVGDAQLRYETISKKSYRTCNYRDDKGLFY